MDPSTVHGYAMEMITSVKNERIKFARSVREGREKGLLFVEGERLAEDCLKAGLEMESAFCVSDVRERWLDRLKGEVVEVTPEVMRSLGDTVTPQGVVLIVQRPTMDSDETFWTSSEMPLLLALDRLQDPGNAGTLLRTAEAAGVTGVAAVEGTTDLFSPKTLRSSMGSAFRVPTLAGLTGESLVAGAKGRGLQIVAADGEADWSFREIDWTKPTLLILGNEGRGVSEELLTACDVKVRIPMAGEVESLNVATAGAVLLFEAARQRVGED